MKCKYQDFDLNQRLHNSFVMYGDEPAYVVVETCEDSFSRMIIYRSTDANSMYYCEDDEITKSDVKPLLIIDQYDPDTLDEKFDISSLQIGYINTDFGTYYMKRNPHRAWKQGLSPDSAVTYNVGDLGYGCDVNAYRLMRSEGFVNSIKNIYPTVSEAIELLKKQKAISISKDIAFKRVGNLIQVYLKNRVVIATFNIPKDGKDIKLKIQDTQNERAYKRILDKINWSA